MNGIQHYSVNDRRSSDVEEANSLCTSRSRTPTIKPLKNRQSATGLEKRFGRLCVDTI
jgi:hypothetical protein